MELKEAILKLPSLLERVEKFLTPTVPVTPAPVEAAAPAPEAAPSTDVKTKDGKVLSIVGEVKPGADIMMDGAPAPDGSYEAEDGSTLVVQTGKLVDIQPKQEEAPMASAPAPVAQAEVPATPSPNPTKVTKYTETIFDAQFASLDELKVAFTAQSQVIEGLVKMVEQIANTPTEKTTFKKKDKVAAAGVIDYENESIAEYRKRNGL